MRSFSDSDTFKCPKEESKIEIWYNCFFLLSQRFLEEKVPDYHWLLFSKTIEINKILQNFYSLVLGFLVFANAGKENPKPKNIVYKNTKIPKLKIPKTKILKISIQFFP